MPLGALTAMFIVLRRTDVPDADERRRLADIAIAQLPLPCRQRVVRAAAEVLRAQLRRQGT